MNVPSSYRVCAFSLSLSVCVCVFMHTVTHPLTPIHHTSFFNKIEVAEEWMPEILNIIIAVPWVITTFATTSTDKIETALCTIPSYSVYRVRGVLWGVVAWDWVILSSLLINSYLLLTPVTGSRLTRSRPENEHPLLVHRNFRPRSLAYSGEWRHFLRVTVRVRGFFLFADLLTHA